MRWKKIGKALLFPPAAVPALLLPVGTVLLVWAMLTREETDGIRIASYVFAFYTLVVCCARLPELVRTVRRVRRENRYVRRWLEDARLRTNATLSANVVWNGAYAALQLMLGIRHQSAWFYSLAGYYASLAVMRLFLVQHTMRHTPGERLRQELTRYRACGRIFLFMNLALSVMMLCRIRQNPAVQHDAVITIAMAAYTFTTLTAAIVQMLRYRRYQSPAMSAAKAISPRRACRCFRLKAPCSHPSARTA